MTGFSSVAQMIATPGATWAHRGGSASWPEMSELAYANSVAAGYGALEFSAGRTSDGVWIGLHDRSINRTSGTTGLPDISEMTWAEVQGYQIVVGASGAPQPYWLLTDFLGTYAGDHVCIVDLKYGNAHRPEFLDILDSYGAQERIIVKFYGAGGGATDIADAATARGYNTWGYFYEADYTSGALDADQSHWSLLGMDLDASQEAWNAALSYGKPVVGHIADDQADYDTAIAKGADMVQCAGVAVIAAVGAPEPPPVTAPGGNIYDFAAWIALAPEFDWADISGTQA